MVEVLGGVAFVLIGWGYGVELDALLVAVTFSFLHVTAIIDVEYKLVLNSVLLVALPIAAVSAVLWSLELRDPLWILIPVSGPSCRWWSRDVGALRNLLDSRSLIPWWNR